MESADTINARAARIQAALTKAFGVRARTLDKALKRTGRRMPRRIMAEARRIVDAQGYGGQPRLMRQIDAARLDRAEARVLDYLQNIDRAEQRRGRILGILAVVVFNLLLVAGAFVLWMWWTGQI